MKHTKFVCLAMSSLLAVSMIGLAACGGDNAPQKPVGSLVPTDSYVLPVKEDARFWNSESVHVHDPSVFYDEASKTYFAFGTHYAVASSKDLIEWTQEVTDTNWHTPAPKGEFGFTLYDEANPVTYSGKQWPAALDETLQIVRPTPDRNGNLIDTTWAPDVNYYNGKYYMYYSITYQFGSDKSAIGRVESNSVTGPYSNNKIIIESVTATGDHPNCIDPELFYDKDGGLWMVYGSFFGGIYIKELYNSGANWGLPKEEEGWGKLLWRNGYSAGVEGPFIFYNPLTEYYYLMTSEGDLNSVYNMRVARSKNPDGPYLDITGKDVATAEGHGNKIAGNFKFARQAGNGYSALGHNSVVQNPKTGEWFVVFHARRYTASNHNLQVSQLYFNEEGWPVMAPSAYVGESFGTVPEAEAAGEYELILHSVANDETQVVSEDYVLEAGGTVKKGTEDAGSWTLKQNFYIEITLGESTYKGVIVPVWDIYSANASRKGVLGITAVNELGNSLWALGK